MKQRIKKILIHPLIAGSIILVLGSFFANLFNFIFSIVMVRLLTPADFGTLVSVNAISGYPVIAANAVTPLIIVLAGAYFAEQKYSLIKGLYIKLTKIFLVIAIIICTAFFIFIPQINSFFNINDYYLLVLADVIIFLSLMGAINTGFLQAKLAFKYYVFILCSMTIVRLIFSSLFVLLGFKVLGAVAGLLLGVLVPYVLSFIPFKFIFDKQIGRDTKIDTKIIFSYGIPSALIGIGLTGFLANDIILLKHYFDPDTAGLYAGLSLLGRIIFFVSAPISAVMFPLIVAQYTKKENFTNTFILALFLIALSSISITAFYTLFPEFSTLFILKKKEYLAIIPYLTVFSISISIYSLLSVFANFYLSIKKTKIAIPVVLAAVLQIVLIIVFHKDIQQIVIISVVVNSLLFLYLVGYYVKLYILPARKFSQ